ncbi:FAD:protein FMN transferase [Aliidiomarina maris]|uniref:FAD:protein FMN transferase n=1 Tax=Aliidiomarina maris TaxID=531312 RepID=A0A327WPB7_9GAMM|nr:FAD:protein FMN transferase [Aliidiomarina maris]MCL5049878.1 FAD:protein FMN transferase [Bacillota bacterium]RAJ93584.1 thiamine biosynthesis lipoprotein [Aliidiomarina maris]RUO18784.1 FAD:protein FMN transferase [Aliidiomarina maris]
MSRVQRCLLPALILFTLAACSQAPEPQVMRGNIFGTFFEVSLGTQHANADLTEVEAGVMDVLNEVDRQMSTYRDDSVLNRINRAELHTEVAVDPELMLVLQRSEAIARMSEGAFDHTVGGLVNLWGFGPEGRVTSRPSQSELESRLEQVGYHFVHLDTDAQTVTRSSDVFVDLSGIAKGYAVDAVSQYLNQQGITNHLVNIGGDIYASGQRTADMRWRVGIEAPVNDRQVVQHILPIQDVAMLGSGDYRNYFESEGVRYSHTIDPTTGEPIAHKLAAVTVLGDNATDADGFASAILVLGPERGLAFANHHNIAALLIVREADGYVSFESNAFSADYAADMTVPRVQ